MLINIIPSQTLSMLAGTFFFSISNIMFGQECLNMRKKNIKSMFIKMDTTISYVEEPNALIVISNNPKSRRTLQFYFGSDNLCDSSYNQYYCSQCAKDFTTYIMNDKNDKWTLTTPNTYLSHSRLGASIVFSKDSIGFSKDRLSEIKQMTIIHTPEKDICTTIIFKKVIMPTKVWKQIMKTNNENK